MATGLVTVVSENDVPTTIARLAEAAEGAGLRVFGIVDHQAGASSVGRRLRPTSLIVLGHPRGGTPLMEEGQTAGIDLPMRALAWEDDDGACWVTYNDPRWIADRHAIGAGAVEAVDAIATGMKGLVAGACAAP